MAVVYFHKPSGLVRRVVFDEIQTDAELEANRAPQDDEDSLHMKATLETFDLAEIQAHVYKAMEFRSG